MESVCRIFYTIGNFVKQNRSQSHDTICDERGILSKGAEGNFRNGHANPLYAAENYGIKGISELKCRGKAG